MERLAEAGGDVDAVIAVHAADLAANGHTHLVIARELDVAGRSDEALRWAERGIQEVRDLGAVDTASSTISVSVTRGRPGSPTRSACAATTSALATAPAGLPAVARRRAGRQLLAGRTRGCPGAVARGRRGGGTGAGTAGPVLVDALLDDKDVEAAWQAATEAGAHERQWLALADQACLVRRRTRRLPAPGRAAYAADRQRDIQQLVSMLLGISGDATAVWAHRTSSARTSPLCAPPRNASGTSCA